MQVHTALTTRKSALHCYGLAVGLVSLALFVSLALQHSLGNPFWFFFSAAIILSTWYGRTGPGCLAVVCSTLAVAYYFTPPLRSFAVKPRELPYFVAFVVCEVVVAQLISWRRRTEGALRQARDELEVKVAARTVELKTANDWGCRQLRCRRHSALFGGAMCSDFSSRPVRHVSRSGAFTYRLV